MAPRLIWEGLLTCLAFVFAGDGKHQGGRQVHVPELTDEEGGT